jgi:hypothetical protein
MAVPAAWIKPRLVGLLHGCVRHRSSYDEQRAWSHRIPNTAA